MGYLFACGDVVRLKSGGAHMTVENYNAEIGIVHLVWFDESKNLRRAIIPENLLEYVPTNK